VTRCDSPQHDYLWPELTTRQHLTIFAMLKRVKNVKAHVEDRMRRVSLPPGGCGDDPVGTYSGGMKRRVSVAMATLGDPEIIFLDEPTTGT